MNIELEFIADEISSGKCLVILGPRLLTKKGEDINTIRNAYLKKKLDNRINDPAQDDFLDFERKDITYIKMGIKKFYENEVEPNKVYQKLAEIPFSLIINTSPDKVLNKIFNDKKKEYDYGYFKMRDPAAKISRKHNTMIYNIFGDYEDIESMVLTFKDLSIYMAAITNLNTKIKTALNEANPVLFFGFSYDKWYFQLLLSFLRLDNNIKEKNNQEESHKIKNAWDKPKEEIKNFYMKEFDLEFFSDNTATQIIDQLHQATKDELITPPANLADEPPQIYISYSHRKKSYAIADLVEKSFSHNDIKLIRDKSKLEIGERISEFMNKIGQGDKVVVIFSDAYLKSEYCMYELTEIHRHGSLEKRILPITLDDVEDDKFEYKKYWQNKKEDLDAKVKKEGKSAADSIGDQFDRIEDIIKSFDDILKVASDMLGLTQKEAEESKFDAFIKKIKDMA